MKRKEKEIREPTVSRATTKKLTHIHRKRRVHKVSTMDFNDDALFSAQFSSLLFTCNELKG